MKTKFKSGYVSVIGRPNTGKSTIVNYFLKEKLSIVTPRPQTTRDNILGILTTEQYQIIFIDTPGFHRARTLLGEHMVRESAKSLQDADAALLVIESSGFIDEDIMVLNLLKTYHKPAFLLINKTDLAAKDSLLPLIEKAAGFYPFAEIIPISAITGTNMDVLLQKIIDLLPEGPCYYPPDQLSDRQERFFVSEIIREQALRYLQEEVPHSVAVMIDDMKDRTPALSYIRATIFVERDSQKMIIIGKNGRKIKEIGQESRKRLEKFLDRKVYLDLWAKVSPNWRKNPVFLKSLGLS